MSTTFLYGGHVNANGIRQHYLRYGGKGPAMILVPGITSPAITWGFVGERFGRRFDTYILDVRGRGLSETGKNLDYDIDTCADDIAAFVRALCLNRYMLVGHSMGARFAIRLARREPEGLDRIVLVDPPMSGPGRRPYPPPLSPYIESIQEAKRGMDGAELRDSFPTWTDDQLRLRAEWLPSCHERAVIEAYKGFHQDDVHADLPRLSVPSLLIAAGEGDVVLPADEDEIRELAPSMQIVRVPGAGHLIPWDDYEGFFSAFGDFLGEPA